MKKKKNVYSLIKNKRNINIGVYFDSIFVFILSMNDLAYNLAF
jgi:hypothetical protein